MPRTPTRAAGAFLSAVLLVTSPGLGAWEAAAQTLRTAAPVEPIALPSVPAAVPVEPGLPVSPELSALPAEAAPLSQALSAPEPLRAARDLRPLQSLGRSLDSPRSAERGGQLRGLFDRTAGLRAAPEGPADVPLGEPLGASGPGPAAPGAAAPMDLGLAAEDRAAVSAFASKLHSETAAQFGEYGFTVRDFHAWVRFVRFFTPSMGVAEALKRGASYVYGDRLAAEKERKAFEASLGTAVAALKLSKRDFGKDPMLADAMRKIAEPPPEAVSADEASPFRMPVEALIPKKEKSDLVLTAGTLRRMEAAYQAFALRDYMLMTGPPATVKSAIVKYLAGEYKIPHLAVNMHPGIGTFELVGGYRPRDIRITDLGDAKRLVLEALETARKTAASPILLDSARKVYGEAALEPLLAKIEADLAAADAAAARRVLTMAHGLAYGSNSLVWVDGYLSYAIKRDIWITFEELNAAPTEVLEFLNEFMRSRRLVVTQKLGEVETLSPRQGGRFMLWATKNDDQDSNRNVLAQTLTNRWRVKAFGPLPALEQAEILEKRYGIPTLWSVALVQNFHEELARQAEARQIGADWRDGYSINLRHLLKTARRWKHFTDQERAESGREPDKSRKLFLLAREAMSVYGGMLRRQDERDGCFKLLDQALKLHGAGITQASVTEAPKLLEDLGDRLKIGDVYLRKGKGGPFVPKPNPDYLADETVHARLYEYAKALALGEPLLLMGETAAGKTSDLEYLFFRLNRNLRYKNLDSDTAIEDAVGGYVKKNGVHVYEEGLLPAAMDEGTGAFLDELNLNPLIEWLNTVADDGRLYLPHRIVEAGEDFSLVAAANPPDPRYEGRILLSPAVRSRLTELWVPLDVSQGRLTRLMDHWLKGGTIYSLFMAAALGAAHVYQAVFSFGFGKKKVLSLWSRFRGLFRRGKGGGAGGGDELARPKNFEELLKERGVPPEKWPEMQAKAERIRTIVRMVGTAVGRDAKLRFEPGYLWAFFPDLNVITYPFEHLLTHSEDEIIGLTDHEGSHREFTVFDDRYPLVRKYTEDPHKMFLWNALEDPRVNNGTIRRLPGSERYFHSAYDRYLPEDLKFDPKEQEKLAQKGPEAWLNPEGDGASAFNPEALKLPHIEYLMAANYYWRHGKEPPKWNNESAKEVFQKTRAALDDIFTTLPPRHDSPDDEKLAAQLQTLEKIDKRVLPLFEPLVKESESKMKKMMKGKGKGKGQGKDGPPAPPSPKGQGKEDKEKRTKEDERAEAMLRDHARKTAEKLGSKIKLNPKKKDAVPDGAKGKAPGAEGKPGGGEQDPSALTIQDIADAQVKNALSVPNEGYQGTYRSVAGVGNQMVTHLENVFLKNARPRDVGYYKKGKRPDLKRIMRREGEGSERDDVWLRRTMKTKRKYKVTVLVDESGSMQSYREEALRGVVLFIESLSRLQIDVEVIGFGDKAFVHKAFGRPMSPADKEKLFQELHAHVGQAGSTHDADALQLAVERIEKEEADRRVSFVVTDGQGNGPSKLASVFPRAAKSQIRVVGVGIGPGMQYVKEAYPHHAAAERIEELPAVLRKTLEEYIRVEEARAGGKRMAFGPFALSGAASSPQPAAAGPQAERGLVEFGVFGTLFLTFGAALSMWLFGNAGVAGVLAVGLTFWWLAARAPRPEARFPYTAAATAVLWSAATAGIAGQLYPDIRPWLAFGCLAASLGLGAFAGLKEGRLLEAAASAGEPAPSPSVPPVGPGFHERAGRLSERARASLPSSGDSLVELARAQSVASVLRELDDALARGDDEAAAVAERRLEALLVR